MKKEQNKKRKRLGRLCPLKRSYFCIHYDKIDDLEYLCSKTIYYAYKKTSFICFHCYLHHLNLPEHIQKEIFNRFYRPK